MPPSLIKLSKILKTDRDYLLKIEKHLSAVTKKEKVLEKIVEENDSAIASKFSILGIPKDAKAIDVYDAIISKIEADNHFVFEALQKPSFQNSKDYEKVLDVIRKISGYPTGLFLKKEKAYEFLKNEPPKKVMEFLGYESLEKMLANEDLFEIFSALRFVEGNDWLNKVFFKQYEKLTFADFEKRKIEIQILPTRWNKVSLEFVKKKWHNISHLKEMGVIFVIPISLGISGELLRMISLIFHYLNEISFYSQMFEKIKEIPETFSNNFISLLRGDVLERKMPEGEKTLWYVIQRYLAKDDENEWRLFIPHINPEAIHWKKAGENIYALGKFLGNGASDLDFWMGTDFVGEYFKNELGEDTLVSFNLMDVIMSLVERKAGIKYDYHQKEALWNKIFASYFSFEDLEFFCKEYLLQGYFEV